MFVLCETICYSMRRNAKYFEKSFLLSSPLSLCQPQTGARRFPVVFWLFGVSDACWQTSSALSLCIAKFVGGWMLSACVPRCWVTMSSAGRLADVYLMLQIQSCHCVESATEMCVFVCVCVQGARERGVLVMAERSFAKEVIPLPKLAKQTCGGERFICPTSPVVIMERWPFYSSRPPLRSAFVS